MFLKLAWVGCLLALGCQTPSQLESQPKSNDSTFLKKSIPSRSHLAQSADQLSRSLKTMKPRQRELRVLAELRRGNIPNFLRRFFPVKVPDSKTGRIRGYIWVSPDYLSVGSSQSHLRMPMNPIDAQRTADHFSALLPTSRMVDLIYQAAAIQLQPKPKPPTAAMVGFRYIEEHHATIESQLRGKKTFGIVAGHKKDVILSNLLAKRRGRVAIYGWHQKNGKVIQPSSTAHHHGYADYSHGIRLVHNMMYLDGVWEPVAEVLQDPVKSKLLSYEGPLKKTRIHTECRNCL